MSLVIDNEQYYLGTLLMDGSMIDEARLKARAFQAPEHKLILNAMLALRDKNINVDVTTVVNELGEEGITKMKQYKSQPVKYLADLAQSIPTTANFKLYEEKIIEQWKVEQGRRHALKYAENPSLSDLRVLSDQLIKLDESGNERPKDNKQRLINIYQRMGQPKTGEVTGRNTGYNDLNRMTEGFHGNQLSIIGARPSVGKTALALNLAENIHDSGTEEKEEHVVIFSLEMTAEELLTRMAGMKARIPQDVMKSRTVYERGYGDKFNMAIGELEQMNLHIVDEMGLTAHDIRAITRSYMNEYPDANFTVMIDYLTLIRYDGSSQNRSQQLGEIGNGLKGIAKHFDIPVLALAQLNRGVESRQDKRPSMSDLRDSGELEQIADLIILLYRDDYYDRESENQNIIELIIDKQRNGATGTIELAFIKEYGLFVNLDHRYSSNDVPNA